MAHEIANLQHASRSFIYNDANDHLTACLCDLARQFNSRQYISVLGYPKTYRVFDLQLVLCQLAR
jgi:hypothetical protein